MREQLDRYHQYHMQGGVNWPEEDADAFGEITSCAYRDPDKALAFIVLASSRTDDEDFLGMLACLLLEDVLENPSEELLERIVAEAKSSESFRWLLSHPYQVAIAPRAWQAIQQFRTKDKSKH